MGDQLISEDEVEHIALLAKIKLDAFQKKKFAEQFNDILNYFKQLSTVDTSNIEPTIYVNNLKNVTRPDVPSKCLPLEKALMNAPEKQNGFIKAPKII
ncbi:MAG: Asp-tRNA(Asn)/Glu-tRNA(Gln) amidotransferase subunit GatC [Candidatus Odinarchaeia archaeon]